MGTRQAPGSLDRDDLPDLVQREAEPLRLPDERQQVQGISAVDPVARFGAPRRGQNARVLVQPERLPAGTALLRHLTDQQPVSCHDQTIAPAPGDKVKRAPGSGMDGRVGPGAVGVRNLRRGDEELGGEPSQGW